MNDNEDFYWYWLCNISGIGNVKIRSLLEAFETPENIYQADEELLCRVGGMTTANIKNMLEAKKDNRMYEEYLSLSDRQIHFTHLGKEDYPAGFYEIYDKPYALYYKGSLPENFKPAVSVIGARACTEYGRATACQFAEKFSDMGIQVISGMAAGIDAAGHKGALRQGGYTLAVFGCGIDICYPRENIGLYMEILESGGGVISEYPPGTVPNAGNFPQRNRLISALSDVVVVVEARKKSGSLITVDAALEQNKDIMAVPGRIGDLSSEGCNYLIQMGAQMILKPEDILSNRRIAELCNEMEYNKNLKSNKIENEKKAVSDSGVARGENMLYSLLDLYPKSINTIIEETGMKIPEVSGALLELELAGLVKEVSKGCFVRIHL